MADLPGRDPYAAHYPAPEPVEPLDLSRDGRRRAQLRRTVAELTREWRASVREYGEFDVLLVRGQAVNHDRHLRVVTALAVLALAAGLVGGDQLVGWMALSAMPVAYAFYWLFLTVTGGEELEHISVDEQGRLHSRKSGRSLDARGDFLRVALPIVVIGITGWFGLGLLHDVIFPPSPKCNVPEVYWPESCFTFPRVSGGNNAPAATDAAARTVIDGALTVEETKSLERFVHTYLLTVNLGFFLPATWFLFRMLTGRWVAFIRPISRSRRE